MVASEEAIAVVAQEEVPKLFDDEAVQDTVDEAAPSASVEIPTAPSQEPSPAPISESTIAQDAPANEEQPTTEVADADEATVEVPPPEDQDQATHIIPHSLAALEESMGIDEIAPEKAEEIRPSSEELGEDSSVVAAEAEVSNGSGNGNGVWYQGTTEIHKIEIPDIIHRSVSENIGSSVLSAWSDDNTQAGGSLSPLSPTTLVDEGLTSDLASKIEGLLAGNNGHEFKTLEDVSAAASKDIDTAPTTAEISTSINEEEHSSLQ
ncbi:hypothetical protein BJ912DRAFT_625032 [Pholiota molesta]|nr:hypothetical protein BJ912DRAFT_625032 [Pholiota molesta]